MLMKIILISDVYRTYLVVWHQWYVRLKPSLLILYMHPLKCKPNVCPIVLVFSDKFIYFMCAYNSFA